MGSNIEPEKNVEAARALLSKEVSLISSSDFKFTKPVGDIPQADFLNGAFLIETPFAEEKLRSYLKDLEERLGRVRGREKNTPRVIDLDLVVFNGQVVDNDFQRYAFVREAALELLPELSKHAT